MLRFIQIYDSCLLTLNTIGIKEKKQTLYIQIKHKSQW